MPTGDKSAQSYGWRATLDAPVPDGASVEIPTPGFDTRYTDTRYPDVSVGSTAHVYRASDEGKVSTTFDATEGASKVLVVNHTGVEWPVGDSIYVFCPHLLAAGSNEWDLKEQIWDLQQRVSALEGATMQETQRVPAEDDPDEPSSDHHPKKKR
jgi:uncharacterized protein YfaP (DUF2135 family)